MQALVAWLVGALAFVRSPEGVSFFDQIIAWLQSIFA